MSHTIKTIKHVGFGLLMGAAVIGGFSAISGTPATALADVAGSNGNVSGYVWSSNIGWISLNCHQGSTTGTSVCSTSPYSVNVIPNAGTTAGIFDGFAWSPNIGWISFRSADVAACGPQASLNLDTTSASLGQVSGWARALAGNTSATDTDGGGWDGCISMRGASPAYGVSYTSSATTNNLTGYAWGDTNVGWVSFTNATLNLGAPSVDLKINGGDTPVALGSGGGSVALTWTTANLSSADCSATSAWTGPKSSAGGSESGTVSANSTSSTITKTYTITCTGNNGATVTDSVTATVAGLTSTSPFLSFLVNGTGSVTVPTGSTVNLTWETQNVQPGTCVGRSSGSFSGWNNPTSTSSKTSSLADATYSEAVAGVSTSRTYTLHGCMGSDGTALTDRTVNITIGTTVTGGSGTATGSSGKPPWEEF